MVDIILSITQEVKNEEDAIAYLVQHGVIKPINDEYCIEGILLRGVLRGGTNVERGKFERGRTFGGGKFPKVESPQGLSTFGNFSPPNVQPSTANSD